MSLQMAPVEKSFMIDWTTFNGDGKKIGLTSLNVQASCQIVISSTKEITAIVR